LLIRVSGLVLIDIAQIYGVLVGIQEKPVPVVTFVVKQAVTCGWGGRGRRIVVWFAKEDYVSPFTFVLGTFLNFLGFSSMFALVFCFARDSMLLVSLQIQDCWKVHDIFAFVFA